MSATRMPLARLPAPWHAVEIWLALVSESLSLYWLLCGCCSCEFLSYSVSVSGKFHWGIVVIFLMDKLNNGNCHIIITLLHYTQSPSYEY